MWQKIKSFVGKFIGPDSVGKRADRLLEESKDIRRRAEQLVGAAVVLVALAACGSCPPGTSENLANVEAIVAENDAGRAAATTPDSVKAAQALRNREAVSLAKALAEACSK